MMVNRLTTGQLSDNAFDDTPAAFGVTTITLTLRGFRFGFSPTVGSKCPSYVDLLLELTGFVTSDVASIPFEWLYDSAFTCLS